ncbi:MULTISPECIES: hypothetical protein [unclassified Streptomyces]|uniref:hypothetical protein n=1 Tax=unclassified Streptomyces TaxID=2593676 RepID=UPI00339F84F1
MALLAGDIALDVLLAVSELRFLLTGATTDFFDPAVFGALDLNTAYDFAYLVYVATGVVFIVFLRGLPARHRRRRPRDPLRPAPRLYAARQGHWHDSGHTVTKRRHPAT